MPQDIYPVKPHIAERAYIRSMEEYQRLYRLSLDNPDWFWGEQAKAHHVVPPVAVRARLGLRGGGLLLVFGRAPQRVLQLHRPPSVRARRPDGHHLGRGRAGRLQAHQLPRAEAQRGARRQRPAEPRRPQGRSRVPLHDDDPGAGVHDAGVRAHRRRALGRVRRLLRRRASRPDHRRALQGRRHRERGPARRQEGAAQEDRRPRRRGHGVHRRGARRPAHRHRSGDAAGPRLLARRGVPPPALDVHQRVDGRRGPALHPLHLRQHGQAEGPDAHDGRLPGLRRLHAPARLRLPPGRHLLLRGRHRLGHRPQLHRLRAARERRDDGALRVDAAVSRSRAATGASSTTSA